MEWLTTDVGPMWFVMLVAILAFVCGYLFRGD